GGYPPILAYWWRHLILYIDKEGRNDLSTIDRIRQDLCFVTMLYKQRVKHLKMLFFCKHIRQ
ncbi:hypothetical protein CEB37_14600, partial [Acinetobacter baumannii]